MEPAAIIFPQPGVAIDEVQKAIAYAREHRIAVAVRTGGHQYCGASSTSGDNIQLDMSEAFCTEADFAWDASTGVLRTGISWALRDFNAMLTQRGLFVPHGTCSHVRVGGHVQTGGWSQLGRAFGLFGDHVDAVELITADGELRTVTRGVPADAELFYAVLGGSPGNFGVLTHLHMRPHSDDGCKRCGGVSHNGSIGLKVVALYNRNALEAVLQRLALMSDDPTYPRNIDVAVTVMSAAQFVLPDYDYLAGASLDEKLAFDKTSVFGKDELAGWPASLVVALQVRGGRGVRVGLSASLTGVPVASLT